MGTMKDYIKWRGDLELCRDGFNDIDNLVLASISYIDMDDVFADGSPDALTIREISDAYFEKTFDKKEFFDGTILKDSPDILRMIADTNRYRNIRVQNYTSVIDTERIMQFAAMEFLLPDDTSYIAYRGTDDYVVGWKEDFMLALRETEAEKATVDYINRIASGNNRQLRVGGHSKGGHMAVYAAAKCDKTIRDRIINVYNNDGPGFMEETAAGEDMKEILPKLISIIPEECIVGLLMNPVGTPVIVKSTAHTVFQHNPVTWCLEGKSFTTVDDVSKGAKAVDKIIKENVEKKNAEELDKFVENLFSVLESTGALTFIDIKKKGLRSLQSIAREFNRVIKERKTE